MPKRPRDMNQLAKMVVDIATGQVEDGPHEATGKAIGGHARARSMSAERRSEIAATSHVGLVKGANQLRATNAKLQRLLDNLAEALHRRENAEGCLREALAAAAELAG